MVVHRLVTPEYFSLLGITIVADRAFTKDDRAAAEDAVLISQSLSRCLFPNQNPLGKRLRASEGPYRPILGIVADVKNAGLTGKDDPEYYELRRHHPSAGRGNARLLIQSTGASFDPRLPVEIFPFTSQLAALTAGSRIQSAFLGGFALAGLALAAIGLYGVLAVLVARRTKEIGVGMTLGDNPGQVRQLVLRPALAWTALGLALGLGASYAANFQQGSGPATAGLADTALLFAWIPSARFARVDPATALRWE